MASPQVENGHINIANELIDKFCSYRISGQEWQVLWVVIRKTWGWIDKQTGSKKKVDSIPLSQFQNITGIDRRKCHAILNRLVDKNIINKGVTQKGDRSIITYGFQKNYDLWKVSPKKVTITQKGDKSVTQKDTLKRKRKENIPPMSPKKINGEPKRKKFIPPTEEQVIRYFLENGYLESAAKKAHAYYEAGDWKDSQGKPVKNWKQKMRGVWFEDKNKKQQATFKKAF
jgi:phage replication O-like protein O